MSANSTLPPTASSRVSLVGDTWGGFAAMLVALPSSIAYGVTVFGVLGADYVAHGVRAGIVGAMALGLVAALVGGAAQLISAPCAPAAAVLAALVGESLIREADPARRVALLALVALLSGALQFFYGFIGGGRLIKYIPYPVVSGYLSAVGVIIFLGQLPKFLGLAKGVALGAGLAAPAQWQLSALFVGGVTVAGVVLAPKFTKAVPAPILGLTAGLAAYFALALRQPELLQVTHNPLVIGPVGGGGAALFAGFTSPWALFHGVGVGELRALIVPALTLSILLSVDTLKTCVVVDALSRSRHDSNRTLLGQGAGNFVSALLGGMPGAGTMGATLVNLESGGRTRRSGLIAGGCVLAAALVLGEWIAWVPVPALAGILLVVGVRMVDWGSILLLRQRDTALDFAVIATVVTVAVSSNLIAASGAGVALAIVLFLREQIQGSVIRRRIAGDRISSTQHRLPAECAELERHGDQTLVCELQGSLFFGTTDQLLTELDAPLRTCRFLILDLRRVQSVDYTAVHLLERFEATLAERGGWLIFSRVPARLPTGRNLGEYFAKLGVMDARRHVRNFASLDDALIWVEDAILTAQRPGGPSAAAPLALDEFDLTRELASDQTLAALASCVVERSCAADEVVFKAGDTGQELFLVRRGIVRLTLPLTGAGHHNLASIGRGNFFGEMSFLTGAARSADAIATAPTDFYVFSRSRFDEVSRAYPVVGVKMFARIACTLALRLGRTDAELRALYEA